MTRIGPAGGDRPFPINRPTRDDSSESSLPIPTNPMASPAGVPTAPDTHWLNLGVDIWPRAQVTHQEGQQSLQQAQASARDQKAPQLAEALQKLERGLESLWEGSSAVIAAGVTAGVTALHYSITPLLVGITMLTFYTYKICAQVLGKALEKKDWGKGANQYIAALGDALQFAVDPKSIKKRFQAYHDFLTKGKIPDPKIEADLCLAATDLLVPAGIILGSLMPPAAPVIGGIYGVGAVMLNAMISREYVKAQSPSRQIERLVGSISGSSFPGWSEL